MKTLDQVLELWSIDAEMDRTQLGNELINIPKLHNKYLSILVKHKLAAKKAQSSYAQMKNLRSLWHLGKLSQDELILHGWEPSPLTVLKAELGGYLDADKNLIKILERKMFHDECVYALESIMGEIKNRNWELRSFIDWTKFTSGV